MKVERSYTDRLMQTLNDKLPPPRLVLKHADKFTAGIADVSCSWNGSTNWIEVKRVRPGERLRSVVEMVQVVTGMQLAAATKGRAFFVVYGPRYTELWTPAKVLEEMRSETPVPSGLPSGVFLNFRELLLSRGNFRIPVASDHEAVVRLIRDFDTNAGSCYR